eukprot:5854696-Amphidinium_carterae.1
MARLWFPSMCHTSHWRGAATLDSSAHAGKKQFIETAEIPNTQKCLKSQEKCPKMERPRNGKRPFVQRPGNAYSIKGNFQEFRFGSAQAFMNSFEV